MIIGIVATVSIPSMNGFLTDETANAAADGIVTAIYYARSMAITTGVDHRVKFNTVADTFLVEKYTGGAPPKETFATVEDPLTKRDYTVSLDPVDVTKVVFGADAFVRFDNLGAPVQTGAVMLEYAGRLRKVAVTVTSCSVATS